MNLLTPWRWTPLVSNLAADDLHIWCLSLEQPLFLIEDLYDLLSTDEQIRAARFHFERDRHHFIAARGILRVLLSHYLNTPARKLRFSYNSYGKPALDPTASYPDLRFNLSHSHQLALYIFTWKHDVGIDVEYQRSLLTSEYKELALHHFSPYEYQHLCALPEELQPQAFFACWTRKEAYIKARGMGLSIPLDQFDVSLAPGEPAALLANYEDPRAVERWHLHSLTLVPGYAGAYVIEQGIYRPRFWLWQPSLL